MTERLTDPARLRAVAATELLDTPAEEAFDRLTRLAAALLDTPAAQVTLVDDRRSFWKSFTGAAAASVPIRENPVEESFCQYVIAEERPVVIDDTTRDPRTERHPLIEQLGVLAWAGMPIRDPAGEILGTFCVIDQRTRSWTARELTVLETLAQAAMGEIALRDALRQAREHARQLEIANATTAALAHTLQRSLLPPRLPDVPGLDVAARYRPAGAGGEVLGDFYDLFQTGTGSWGVVLGDVAGKGVAAATVTGLARHTVRAAAMHQDLPSEVLGQLNEALLARQRDQGADDERFLTAAYASLHLGHGQVDVVLCSAGHTPVLVRRADGTVETIDEVGLILGVFTDVPLADTQLILRPGDSLLLYTDGVLEARRDGELFGEKRLLDVLATDGGGSATALAAAVEDAVLAYAGTASDDVAILALRVLPPDE